MLTPEYLAGISGPLQEIYGQLQQDIEADIARRIAKAGYLSVPDTAAWQIEKLKQMGASQAYIAEQIARSGHHKLTAREMESLFEAAGIKTCATDEATRKAAIAAGALDDTGIPLAASPAVKQILAAGMRRTGNTLTGLTRSMALDAAGKLNKQLDRAQLMVQSGAFTTQQAIDATVTSFADEGITAFDYASGVSTSIEAAVRRALVTGVNQTTAEVSLANASTLGTDLVEVTSHGDARPEHAEWQGKVYSIAGGDPKHRKLSEATGYGTGAGLCGWNCRHSFYAFIEGVSEEAPRPAYNPALYAAEQKQRYQERMIRTWKRKANTLAAGGVDTTAADKRVAAWQAKQREHVKKYDLARMYDREKVYGMTTAAPRPKIKKPPEPTPAELAAAKAARLKEENRERTRKWREAKKAPPAPAPAPEPAPAPAAPKAESAAEKAARLKEESRERTRAWRAAKKGATPAPAAPAAPAPAPKPAPAAAEADEKYIKTVYHGTDKKGLDKLRVRPEAELRSPEEEPLAGISFSPDLAYSKGFSGESGTIFETKIDTRKFVSVYSPGEPGSGYAILSAKDRADFDKLIDYDERPAATKFLRDRGYEGGVIRGIDVTGIPGSPDEFVIIHDVDTKKMGTPAPAPTPSLRKPPGPIRVYGPRVGEPGTYQVYRSTAKTIPADGITAFHGLMGDAGSVMDSDKLKEYLIDTKKPLVIEAPDKGTARVAAFEKLTGETARTFPGDKGAAVARELHKQGYDSIIYKFPDGRFELDPIDFSMAKKTGASEALEKASKEAAEKAAKETAARKAAEAAAKKEADEKATKAAAAKRAKYQAEQAAKGKRPPGKTDTQAPTLANFEATRDKDLAELLGRQDPGTMERAVDYAAAALDQGVPRSRINQDTMRLVLKDGKLKTQIELDAERKAGLGTRVTSGGMNNPESRKRASGELFGTDIHKTRPQDFEYYGYIWDDDFVGDFQWDGPSHYGASTVQLKPAVRGRTTLTCGDSLGKMYIPSYLEDVTPCWDLYGKSTDRLATLADHGAGASVEQLCDTTQAGYVELQMHGGITLDDVESFVIGPADYDRNGIDKTVAKALNERGIKVGLVEETRQGKKFRWLTEEDWK